MTILGMTIATVILFLSFYLIGPYGIAVLLILTFGMIFSTHQKNKEIYEDLKRIREKLGLLSEAEKMQIEIDKSIEKYEEAKEDSKLITELNKEIEEELETYIIANENKGEVKNEI